AHTGDIPRLETNTPSTSPTTSLFMGSPFWKGGGKICINRHEVKPERVVGAGWRARTRPVYATGRGSMAAFRVQAGRLYCGQPCIMQPQSHSPVDESHEKL